MKKIIVLLLIITAFAVYAAGCSQPVSATGTPADSTASSPEYSMIPTTQPEPTVEETAPAGDSEDDTQAVAVNGRVYYLDANDDVAAVFNEDPPLRVKNADGSADADLGIRGFQFDIIGNYIYIDSNDTDLNSSGQQTWSTTRMNLDGSDKQALEYESMSSRLIPQGEQKYYFTTLGNSAVYVSDFATGNVTTVHVNLPDRSELDENSIRIKYFSLPYST